MPQHAKRTLQSLEILRREHQWIGWMAETLESLVAQAEATDRLPEEAYELLCLYESFADGRHQDKEEQVLFVELLAAAGQRDREILQRLLRDHEEEKRLMAGMRANVLGAVHGRPASVRDFVLEARDYMTLHQAHMSRENEILFSMAERLLTPEADERVAGGFEAIEGGKGDPHGVREQALGLRQRVGLPRPPAA